ncbi:hypothetical protein LOZ58_006683 [Ophidiomyces ophidiicola]|nr:hypothetical protein LOZ65_005207 [Ophidiomyces ophidiicola]KAI1955757.1 hypothetical protein LOZ58_006683 [Ophidiomyces ophidiicola]
MQNRIDRLESVVLSLMTNSAQHPGSGPVNEAVSGKVDGIAPQHCPPDVANDRRNEESDTEQVTKSFGILKVDAQNQKSYYISEAHWTSILNDIAEVRNFRASHKKQIDEQMEKVRAANRDHDLSSSALIFGTMKSSTKTELLALFPSKYTADILVARYFNTLDSSMYLIHTQTFQKQYAKHWQDPSKTSIAWIGMLFAMMRLAILSYHRDDDAPTEFRGKCLDTASSYRSSMAQCLVFVDFTKPHTYVLETLILHLQGEYSQSHDAQVSLWVLVGIIVRLAMRMGYHRDSKMFSNVSIYHGEMRRRTWSFIRCADLLFSFQVGLPSMIRSGDSDTDCPRSLYDDDFDEDSIELPPERPFNEPTPISYLIVKYRLTLAFGRVLECSQKINGTTYEELMEIDNSLRQAREVVPKHLRIRPLSECDNDPADLVVKRFGIMSIYHKAQCVLHRPFLHRARKNPRYSYSRRACIDSSMELLNFQLILHNASGPGGKLRHRSWYSGSFSFHDFLMASTIIALDLHHDSQSSNQTQTIRDAQRQQEMLTALQRTRDIWDELKDSSMDAWKGTVVLGLLLEKLNQSPQKRIIPDTKLVFDAQDEKQSAAITLGLLSSGMTPRRLTNPPQLPKTISGLDQTQQDSMENIDQLPSTTLGMLGQMPDMQPFNLDWVWALTKLRTGAPIASHPNKSYRVLAPNSLQRRWLNNGLSSSFAEPRETVVAESSATKSDDFSPNDRSRIRSTGPPRVSPTPKTVIYVGNIFFDVTADQLRNEFSKCGPVESARIIYDPRGVSRGFGYMKFQDVETAQKAVNLMHGQIFEGRRLAVNFAQNDEPVSRSRDSQTKRPTRTLFIGNMSFEMTDRDLHELFKDIENVIDVRVAVDRRTGQARGFAHAEFVDAESAEKAFAILHGQSPYGRPLRLDYSFSTPRSRAQDSDQQKDTNFETEPHQSQLEHN